MGRPIRRHRGAEHPRRLAGKRIIEEQARRQVRTFLDELRNGTTNYRTVASLGDQVAQEYRGRAVLELLQNAHDVLGGNDDPGEVSFVLNLSAEQPELLIANSGRPFRHEDFSGICELAQSPKDPNESVGNKGLGFRSVLELTTCPEVWSTAPAGDKPAFAFRFHPEVLDPIVRVAQALVDGRPATDPAFGGEPVVDWSERQVEEYRGRVSGNGIKSVEQVEKWISREVKHLSPYVLPRALGDPPAQVARLLDNGHVTVIRLPLDGGRAGSAEEAVQSVREQLVALDEAAMVFLRHLSVLRSSIDGDHTELTRAADSERSGPVPATRYERLRVSRSAADASDLTQRSFHVWSRTIGGSDQPAETERVAAAVRHLPNRWPEVQKVEVAVAVEETRKALEGAFVIFLPTTMKTGVGAHVNAPFYGSLDRKNIDFGDEYNELLLEFLADVVRDAVIELVSGSPEPWRGRAVIDLLAQAGSPASDDPELTRRFHARARDRDDSAPLEQMELILCDGGWRRPSVARTMPNIPAKDPFGEAGWRGQAGFAVVSSALDERRDAVEALLGALGGSPQPTDGEWADTLERMAEQVRRRQGDAQADRSHPAEAPADWNMFLGSVLAVLPPKLRSEPGKPETDALAEAAFLPTEDGRLLSASDADAVRIFFQPRSGADDAADFVGTVPDSLKERMAFLHHDVETHEGPQRRRTKVQKFLDGRFVQSFRRADLLRVVIVPSLPDLPSAHGSPEAARCADALAWSLEVVGGEEPEGLLDRLAELPVACTDGWIAMKEAVFGPGWAGRSGDHLKTLADGLPGDELRDGGRSVARSEPRAHWLSRQRILVLRRDIIRDGSYEETAGACQAILDRQDLLKDLRLVLGALDGNPQPTGRQIEAALDRAEIDAVAVADIRLRWIGETTMLLDRLRPLAKLLKLEDAVLDADKNDTARLTEWLAHGLRDRSRHEDPMAAAKRLLEAARECYDDAEMGMRAYEVIGDAAELPKWNEALSALGGKYERVRNPQARAQAKRYLDEAAPLLRPFARHVATTDKRLPIVDQGTLFARLAQVHERLEASAEWSDRCAEWSDKYWNVPFGAVLGVLRAGYDEIPEAKPHLAVFDGAGTVERFREALKSQRIALDRDPREVARRNQSRFDQTVRTVRTLYECWLETRGAGRTSSAKAPDVRLDESIHLRDWSDEELLGAAKQAVAGSDFRGVVKECATMEEMRERLGITLEDLEHAKGRCAQRRAEKERQKGTVEVAGEPFEIGGPVSYSELFVRLLKLPDPPGHVEGIGPPPPGPAVGGGMRTSVSSDSELFRRGRKTSHRHGPPDVPELVGIVGEMHAFRFLKGRFGIDQSAWVSESRTRVVPLLDGEEDVTSDSLGYDFRFTRDEVTWCVEVKATKGDGPGFELPASELNAASRIASRRNERWRILRVVRALTRQPACYWLPNPCEPGPGERLRLVRKGGATVEYALPKDSEAYRSAADTPPPSGPEEQ